jgi:hypothetical protein
MMPEDLDPNWLYDVYNKKYFGGKLPKTPVVWCSKRAKDKDGNESRGVCQYVPELMIFLNPVFQGWETTWSGILIHEMVHVEQRYQVRAKDHGYNFKRRMRELAAQGAFDELW